jgi:hypothetical protein
MCLLICLTTLSESYQLRNHESGGDIVHSEYCGPIKIIPSVISQRDMDEKQEDLQSV